MYLAQQNYGMWSVYLSLANSTGYYDYSITVDNEENYVRKIFKQTSYS